MNLHEQLIERFYAAFRHGDYKTMQSCYHDEAQFSDPVFEDLNAAEVKAMWEMLLTSAKDLQVSFDAVWADERIGSCSWQALYTFSRTGRHVHNVINAQFEFKDGKIYRHRDSFNMWRWSRQALGLPGLLLGWSSVIPNKVRKTARESLTRFMTKS